MEPSIPNSSAFSDISVMNIVTFVVGIIFSIANLVFMILAIDKFGKTNWGNENLNKYKNAFWITTLCCLIGDFIASTLMVVGSIATMASALLIIGLVFSIPLGITPPIMWLIWSNMVKNTYSTNTQAQ